MSSSLKDRAEQISRLSRERNMTLATVESCTAGSLAHLLSDAEGASEILHGGFVVYTKANKVAAVGVPEELLAHTAVSAEVAQAMAKEEEICRRAVGSALDLIEQLLRAQVP